MLSRLDSSSLSRTYWTLFPLVEHVRLSRARLCMSVERSSGLTIAACEERLSSPEFNIEEASREKIIDREGAELQNHRL